MYGLQLKIHVNKCAVGAADHEHNAVGKKQHAENPVSYTHLVHGKSESEAVPNLFHAFWSFLFRAVCHSDYSITTSSAY